MNLISTGSERGSTQAILLKLLIFLCALSSKSLLRTQNSDIKEMEPAERIPVLTFVQVVGCK